MYRAIQTLPLIGAVIASSLLVGCSGEGVTPSVQENVAIELGFEGRTTRGDIAIKNLSSQVAGREATARLRPADMTAQGQLVDLLLGRAQYAGTYSDFDRAVEVVEDALIRSNNSDEARIIQARVERALHNFRPAR